MRGPDGAFKWSHIRANVGPTISHCSSTHNLAYPNLLYAREEISTAEFLRRLATAQLEDGEGSRECSFSIADATLPMTFLYSWMGQSNASGDRCCGEPNWQVWANLEDRMSGPFVSAKPDHPFFPDATSAFAELGGMRIPSPDDIRMHSFLIVVSDQRGRIDNLVVSDEGAISVQLSGHALSDMTLHLRHLSGAWGARATPEVLLPDFDLPSPAELVLVSSDHEIIDRRAWDVYPAPAEDELGKMIQEGENELVEFKPWIELGGDKFGEIVDTIIAMANGTSQGTVIVGVDDFGRPAPWKGMKDYEAAAKMEGGRSSSQKESRINAARCYAVKLIDRLQDRITPFPPVERPVPVLEFEGSVVLQLNVSPSPTLVHHSSHNYTLVRCGASNRHAHPQLLRTLIQQGR